jgi:hypothetical protein
MIETNGDAAQAESCGSGDAACCVCDFENRAASDGENAAGASKLSSRKRRQIENNQLKSVRSQKPPEEYAQRHYLPLCVAVKFRRLARSATA